MTNIKLKRGINHANFIRKGGLALNIALSYNFNLEDIISLTGGNV